MSHEYRTVPLDSSSIKTRILYYVSLTTKVVDLGERINRCLDPMVFDEHKKVLDNLWYITNLDQIDVIIVNNF